MRLLAALVLTLTFACAHEHGTLDGDSYRGVERVVTDVAHHIDHRDWVGLRGLYADEVETDYTSLFGGEIQKQPADKLMAGWKAALSPVVTQHHLGPITVDLSGDTAVARCHVRGYHFADGASGGDRWMVSGHYVFELKKAAGRWTIYKMKLETFYQTGNKKLLQEAASLGA